MTGQRIVKQEVVMVPVPDGDGYHAVLILQVEGLDPSIMWVVEPDDTSKRRVFLDHDEGMEVSREVLSVVVDNIESGYVKVQQRGRYTMEEILNA